jgi:hypothetical protein
MMHQFKRIQTTSSAKFVGLMLADHLNDSTGRCDPSVALLCAETCLEERAVRRALKALRDGGHITQICRPGCTPIYRLHPQFPAGTTLPQIDTPPHIDTPVELSPLPIETGWSPPNRQGTPPHIDRVPLPISPPKSERTRREPEKNPFASAAANAGDGDSLFPIEPPPPKPAKERKPKPETEIDPRQTLIVQKLADVYQTAMGEKLRMDAADWSRTQSGLKKLLPLIPDADKDDILTNWYNVLVVSKNGSHVPALVHTATRPFNFLNKKNYDVVNRMVVDVSQRQR